MTREEWAQIEKALNNPDVLLAMKGRCEEQGHEWENGCDPMFRLSHQCKWCGETKPGLYP